MLIIQFKIISLALAALLLPTASANMPRFSAPISAESCVLMAADGQCLYEKNADGRHLIASTTKLMTALICTEDADPEALVTIREAHCAVEGSTMYLQAGERYTVRELLLGLMLSSGNDAALALAEYVGGTVEGFVALMNQRAAELGLTQTHFSNPHGLDDTGHYSTARDLANLMRVCMERDDFRKLAGTRSTQVHGRTLVNHNRLLDFCPGCIGGKTGYTIAAGRCLVSCCDRDGLRLVCVTLSAPDDWNDHRRLYDWAYRSYALFDPAGEAVFDVPVISGSRAAVQVCAADCVPILLPRDAEVELRAELPPFVFAPVEKGTLAGSLRVYCNTELICESALVYTRQIPLASPCFHLAIPEEIKR